MTGKGRRGRTGAFPKGRQVDEGARQRIRELLGDRPRRRDLLIEHLHLIQDRYGCLSAAHLLALAEELRLAPVEVYEVATFYAHFDVVEDETSVRAVTVRICDGLPCAMNGAEALIAEAAELGAAVRVVRAPCMGLCDRAPAATVVRAGRPTVEVSKADLSRLREAASNGAEVGGPGATLDAYCAAGGYALLKDCLSGRRGAEEVIAAVEGSRLRGLGGAGFPTGRKWRLVRAQPAPRYLVVNADEGEPGTFKDRHCLETDMHRFLEGVLVAAWAIEAAEVYIYLRDEYAALRGQLASAIAEVEGAGLAGRPVHLRRGAGSYVCGEESAMLESLEGRRGLPRHRPPFAAERGLFGRPTLINNVETLFRVRDIVERGAEWFRAQGRHGREGLRAFSVSGRVREPGVKLAPAGITLRELIDEHCGGMAEGHRLKAYLPGGASGGFLPASLADVPLDFGTIEPHGGFIGSAAIIVLSDRDDLRAAALNLTRFFADESCGQCTPCRVGTAKAELLLAEAAWDRPLLEDLAGVMRDASICGLGQAAPNVFMSLLRHFPEELA